MNGPMHSDKIIDRDDNPREVAEEVLERVAGGLMPSSSVNETSRRATGNQLGTATIHFLRHSSVSR